MFPSIGRKIDPASVPSDAPALALDPSVTFQPQPDPAAPLSPPDLTNLDDLMSDLPGTQPATAPDPFVAQPGMTMADPLPSDQPAHLIDAPDETAMIDAPAETSTSVEAVTSDTSEQVDSPTPSIKDPAPVSGTHAHEVHSNDLDAIKKQALQDLAPLVAHLEGTPEERYQTIMMMLRASDDSSLISVAYTAAREIADEKARAQSLVEIVNEINFLSQPK